MLSRIHTATLTGSTPQKVEVELEYISGLPTLVIIGLPGQNISEAKERITAALQACKVPITTKRTIVNLAPADLKKTSSCMELAIAAGLLQLYGRTAITSDTLCIGELSLNGQVKPVRGALPIVLAAQSWGFTRVIVPAGNAGEVSMVSGIEVRVIEHLSELLGEECACGALTTLKPTHFQPVTPDTRALNAIVGQEQAKRALMIAAAGGHNVHLTGPPGAGKSILAHAITSLLPQLTEPEVLELTALHSLAGLTLEQGIVTTRPFMAPHHSASAVGLLGGGQPVIPGMISLAHRGVLFLDEFPEFPRSVLEALRQPLETKTVTVTRAQGTVTFPADFTLLTAANPCPCGFWGSQTTACRCNEHERLKYQNKLSGPILDRIDIQVWVAATQLEKLDQLESEKSSDPVKKLQEKVATARQLQRERLEPLQLQTTAQLTTTHDILKYCAATPKARALALSLSQKKQLSARKYLKVLKVARTIADLEGKASIDEESVYESTALSQAH